MRSAAPADLEPLELLHRARGPTGLVPGPTPGLVPEPPGRALVTARLEMRPVDTARAVTGLCCPSATVCSASDRPSGTGTQPGPSNRVEERTAGFMPIAGKSPFPPPERVLRSGTVGIAGDPDRLVDLCPRAPPFTGRVPPPLPGRRSTGGSSHPGLKNAGSEPGRVSRRLGGEDDDRRRREAEGPCGGKAPAAVDEVEMVGSRSWVSEPPLMLLEAA